MNKPKCKTCTFYAPGEYGEDGECRKYPPKKFYTNNGSTIAFPRVRNGLWCGGHEEDTSENGPPPR